MDKRKLRKKLKSRECYKEHLRKKIACVGGRAATKLVQELIRVEREISRIKRQYS